MSKKKDEDSWRYGGVKRRDFRHAHDEPEVPRRRNKKDTKRWCKGKVNVEHEFVRSRYRNSKRFEVDKCSKCGKEMGFYLIGFS